MLNREIFATIFFFFPSAVFLLASRCIYNNFFDLKATESMVATDQCFYVIDDMMLVFLQLKSQWFSHFLHHKAKCLLPAQLKWFINYISIYIQIHDILFDITFTCKVLCIQMCMEKEQTNGFTYFFHALMWREAITLGGLN